MPTDAADSPTLVLGTAGHIDHGKTSLIGALTGVDTDRLRQEKDRGITIELGFARLELPSGRSVGVVDVPGHERFVRQMVAGATGIDVVLLVIAADDGVMPQTREHLAIIDLLGIEHGVVAITKADLVEPEWAELVAEDVASLLEGTTLEGSPIVRVSSQTGEGLDELRAALDEMASETASRQLALPMRLPVDRVFTIAGAGTVVTGTLWSGAVRRDDGVVVLPEGVEARVRSVQVHSEQVEEGRAGRRVALNLAGVDKDEISRGSIVAEPGTLTVTDRFDATFTYLGWEGREFESDTRVHVHHGTREVLGRVLLMDTDAGETTGGTVSVSLRPGETALCQVRLEDVLAPRYDDRFIVRSYSPMFTIGGGVVLDVSPPRRTTLDEHERGLLRALVEHDLGAAAVLLVTSRGLPMGSGDVASALGVPRGEVADALNRSDLERVAVGGETRYLDAGALESLLERIEQELLAFHEAKPTATGVTAKALRDRVDARLDAASFEALLGLAEERGKARIAGGEVRHPEAAAAALADEQAASEAVADLLREQGMTPDGVEALARRTGFDAGVVRRALGRLADEGRVVRLGPDMHFAASVVEEAKDRVVAHLHEHGELYTMTARDLLDTSRKYVIPLLEYFDAQGVTQREEDYRVLRGDSSARD